MTANKQEWFLRLIGPLGLLVAWESYIFFAKPVPTLAPSFTDVLGAFSTNSPSILYAATQTLLFILGASLIGGGIGTGLGLLFGRHRILDIAWVSTIAFFATIPIITWLPLFVLWLGISQVPIFACGLLASFFPSFQAGRGAAANPPQEYIEAAKNLGVREQDLVRTVIFPAMLPVLISGWRSSLQLVFLVLPVAEMVLRRGGVGAVVGRGMDLARADLILLGQLTLGLVGALVFFLFDRVEQRWLGWMHAEAPRG